ncbi:DUF4351 domain-containing protein [Cyanobium sp. BA20m-p-22]|nr:DUF4351 domain-containing protein [Cyanobium sp. BA20m-p-22]
MLRAAKRGSRRAKPRKPPKVTLRLLNRRCGPLSEATTAQIQALPVEKLEALAAWLAGNT